VLKIGVLQHCQMAASRSSLILMLPPAIECFAMQDVHFLKETQRSSISIFANSIPMKAFRVYISDWYGPGGGLSGIGLEGKMSSSITNAPRSSKASSTSSTSTSTGSLPDPTKGAQVSRGISGGTIAGIAIGVLAAVAIISILALLILQRVKRKRNDIVPKRTEFKSSDRYQPLGGRYGLGSNARHEKNGHEVGNTQINEMGEVPRKA
jgi:hypothetical protein